MLHVHVIVILKPPSNLINCQRVSKLNFPQCHHFIKRKKMGNKFWNETAMNFSKVSNFKFNFISRYKHFSFTYNRQLIIPKMLFRLVWMIAGLKPWPASNFPKFDDL